ncbi:hypothetical protein [Gracilibacillus sp. YIM 98692]|uniref:hypothetical protein n=1 Tax=Gracilibacillus sp. YIM 98692 TaxID=2663532 RepID=UPI0013D317C5|nr:hypothetical protein [Gracilibacillus sp. YIM 98692]
MTSREWIETNLVVNNEDAIDWGNGIFTPVDNFVDFFDVDIQNALDNNDDVIQAIKNNDDGKGFYDLI